MPSCSCPPPVYPIDAPLADLRTAELLLVATVRLFMTTQEVGVRVRDWRAGFMAGGIDQDAVPAFETLIRIMIAATPRPLDFRCLGCSQLGVDEARLLQLISVFQAGRYADGGALLTIWLPPTAMPLAVLPAQELASAMALGGFHMPLRHSEAALPHPYAFADRGHTLVQ